MIPTSRPPAQSGASTAAASATPASYGPALAVVTSVFFMWGFVTVLNDILIPHLKGIFDLSYTQVMLVQFTFFSAYFILSFPASSIVTRLGYQKAIVLGLAVMGIGALLFLPAAAVASYPFFLGALYVLASGMTILQVAANPYVAELGTPDKASSRLNLAQALNSLGTFIGPLIGGILILSTTGLANTDLTNLSASQIQAHKIAEAASVRMPYLGIGLFLFALAFAISRFHLPVLTAIDPAASRDHHIPDRSIWSIRHLVLGALGIFVYVGAEVSIGSFLINYISQPEIGNIPVVAASRYVSLYWGGAMVGRFIGSWLMRKLDAGKVLGGAAVIAALLVITTMLTTGFVAMWTVILVGLFNSVMFPTIFTLGIDGLGKLTGKGSGLMVAAIVGGAILPVAQGKLADQIGIHHAFLLPVLCYIYVVYYGLRGSRHSANGVSADATVTHSV